VCVPCAQAQERSSTPEQAPAHNASAADRQSSGTEKDSSALADAEKLLRQGRYEEAVEAFRKLAEAHNDPAVAAGLTHALLHHDDLAAAYDTARKALVDFPDSPLTHEAYGEVAFRRGEPWECEKEMAKTINTWGPNARAYLWLFRVYNTMAFHKKADTMLQHAYDLDPNDIDIAYEYRHRPRVAVAPPTPAAPPPGANSTDASQASKGDGTPASTVSPPNQAAPARARHCELVGSPRNVELSLERIFYDPKNVRGFGLQVDVNGKSGRLLVDTGAGGILINHRLAEKAGVQRLRDSSFGGIGDKGATEGYIGRAESITIGGVEFRNCTVAVSETRNVLGDDGLIGTNVFRDFLVDLDMPHYKLKLSPLPKRPDESEQALQDSYISPEMKSFSRFYNVGHFILIPVRVDEAPARIFLVDTGAFDNFISPDVAREVTKVHSDDRMKVKGLSGAVEKVYRADRATLAFSHFKQPNEDLVAFDMSRISRNAGMQVAGTLGYTLLRMLDVRIDYRDDLIEFNYNEKGQPVR
jgi:predicted aspartyl protease/Flp pilus assembly protein TadD